MSKKFTLSISNVICVLTFLVTFVGTNYIKNYNIFKYTSLLIIGIFIFKNLYILALKKYFLINASLIMFLVFVVISSLFNLYRKIERNPFLAALIFAGTLIEMFLVAEIMTESGKLYKMVDTYFKMALLVALLTEAISVFMPALAASNDDRYLIGSKFQVVYMHYLIVAFYIARSRMKRNTNTNIWITILYIWSLLVSIWVNCSTGIVGLVVFFLLYINFSKIGFVLRRWPIFLCVTLSSLAFVFIHDYILNNPLFKYIIINLLNRDLTLTTRTRVYMLVLELLPQNLIWGFGYGSTYELGKKLAGIPNTQNAILNWLWQCGIVTTILMIVFMLIVINYTNKCKKSKMDNGSIICLVYVFVFLGTVEITFSSTFFGLLAVMMAISSENKKFFREQ